MRSPGNTPNIPDDRRFCENYQDDLINLHVYQINFIWKLQYFLYLTAISTIMKRVLVPIFMIVLIIGVAQGTMMTNVNPGKMNVDLGDGYKASFTLPNTGSAYDVETVSSYSDILKSHSYEVYVNAAGSNDSFLMVRLLVESESTPYFIPKAGRGTDLKIPGVGPSVNIPQSIDGFDGYVYYSYPEGNPATNTNEARGKHSVIIPTLKHLEPPPKVTISRASMK